MISFACHKCGKTFSVPEEFAGRSARCKGCKEPLTVPQPAPAAAPAPTPAPAEPAAAAPTAHAKVPMRTRRLMSDASAMSRAFQDSPYIRVQSVTGDPPET